MQLCWYFRYACMGICDILVQIRICNSDCVWLDPDPDKTLDATPFLSDLKDTKKNYNWPADT